MQAAKSWPKDYVHYYAGTEGFKKAAQYLLNFFWRKIYLYIMSFSHKKVYILNYEDVMAV